MTKSKSSIIELEDELVLDETVDAFTVEPEPTVEEPIVLGGVSTSDVDDIAFLITDVDENVEYLTWLIYGKNGTGKTTMLSTVEGMLILAADEGTLSIREKVDKDKAKKIKIDTWDKLEAVYWLLANGKKTDNGILIKLPTGPFLVTSLGFDTLSKLAQICMRKVVLGEKSKDASKDIINPTQRDWGQMTQRMQYWLGLFKELPLQKVWLCQERANADELDSENYTIFPDMSQALRNYVQSEADIIGRTYLKKDGGKVQFRLMVGPHDTAITKDRTNKLPPIIANPRLDALYKKVFE